MLQCSGVFAQAPDRLLYRSGAEETVLTAKSFDRS